MTDKVQKIREEIERKLDTMQYQVHRINAYKELKSILDYIDSLQEEPVSEDLEEAAEEWDTKASFTPFYMALDDNSNPYDVRQHYTTHAESFKAGAKWQKTKDESMSDNLGEYINELSKQFPEVSFAKLSRVAVRVAKWQMAQMIKDATDVTVHVDAGGYPYIPQMELYDYDKDIPLAKEGDKYNVVLIKEK